MFQSKKLFLRFLLITKSPHLFFFIKVVNHNIIKKAFFKVKCLFRVKNQKEHIKFLEEELTQRKKYPGPKRKAPIAPDNNTKEKISIIVPTHNDGKKIEKCIQSLLSQTYKNIEIIIVNDGDDQESANYIEKLSKKEPKIRIFNSGGKGVATARNVGLKNASGKFLMWCDSDDFFMPDTCKKMLGAIISSGCDFATCETNVIYEEKLDRTLKQDTEMYLRLKFVGSQVLNTSIITRTDVSLWNKIYRLDKIKKFKIDFPDGLYFEDAIFNDIYMMSSNTGYYMKGQKLYNYLRKKDSIMSRAFKKEEISNDYLEIAFKLYDYMNNNDLYEDKINFFWTRFCQYASFSLNHVSLKNRIKNRKRIKKFVKEHQGDIENIEKWIRHDLKSIIRSSYCVAKLISKFRMSVASRINANYQGKVNALQKKILDSF